MLKLLILALASLPMQVFADNTQTKACTSCSSCAFTQQLAATAKTVNETDSEDIIEKWIYAAFTDKATLEKVLTCPEVASVAEDETITFEPVKYTFPLGREVVVNYETQPKILKQRISLANKRDLPPSDPSARVGELGNDAIWTNTDPAWYAIMVVENGALREFAGSDKNNTISLQYILDNIDNMYPNAFTNGGRCTSRSALAEDYCAINRAVRNTVDVKGDTNDYYVAGDINLAWIGYAEIALDVVITVVTMGGGAIVSGAAKSARASRALKGMATNLKALKKLDTVQDYMKHVAKIAKLNDEIKALDKVKDAAKIADKTKELDKLKDGVKNLEKLDDVKKYKETAEIFTELNKYRKTLKGFKAIKQRGNVIARGVKIAKSGKAAMGGTKLIDKGAKLVLTAGGEELISQLPEVVTYIHTSPWEGFRMIPSEGTEEDPTQFLFDGAKLGMLCAMGADAGLSPYEILWKTPLTQLGHLAAAIAKRAGKEGIERPYDHEDVVSRMKAAVNTGENLYNG